MVKAEREATDIARAEGLSDVKFEQCRRSSHRWMKGSFEGREICILMSLTKWTDPRARQRMRGNIRQAIRRAEQGRMMT